MAVKIKLNSPVVQEYLDGGHGVRERLYRAAQPVLQALINDPHDDTGAFEAGLAIREAHTDRLVLRVGSSDPKGHVLEAKYGLHVRALDAAR